MVGETLGQRLTVRQIRHQWLLWLGGGLSVLAGLLAIVFPLAAAVGFSIVLGAALAVVGIFELARAFSLRRTRKILSVVLFGLLALVTGAWLLVFPIKGVAVLTIVVTAFLIVGGLFKIWSALSWRPHYGWPWMVASGVLSVLLGGLLVATMPGSAFWALGLLIGVDLLFFGATQLIFAARAGRAETDMAEIS